MRKFCCFAIILTLGRSGFRSLNLSLFIKQQQILMKSKPSISVSKELHNLNYRRSLNHISQTDIIFDDSQRNFTEELLKFSDYWHLNLSIICL